MNQTTSKALALLALIALAGCAVTTEPTATETVAPIATENTGPPPTTVAAPTTTVPAPTTTVPAPTTASPTTTQPDPYAAFVPYLSFMYEEVEFATDVSEQLGDFSDDLSRQDLSAATSASIELWRTFVEGDRAPDGYPLAREHDTMMDDCEAAFDSISDILIASDYERLVNEGPTIMDDCMAGITNLTDAIVEVS